MKASIHGWAAGAAFAIYVAVGATAFAQPASSAATSPAQPPARMGAESQAQRADRLRAVLQLKPAQEPALQAYVAALDSSHRAMMDGMQPGSAPATTPERLARMRQMMERHQSAMTAMIEATQRFYDQLDVSQKRAFDALPMTMMHDGMGPMGGGRMSGKGRERGSGHMHTAPPR